MTGEQSRVPARQWCEGNRLSLALRQHNGKISQKLDTSL